MNPYRLAFMPSPSPWLRPTDLALSVLLARIPRAANCLVLEVGVWKGAWSIGMLRNTEESLVVGIDPFPGATGPSAAASLRSNLIAAGVAERFRLAATESDALVLLRGRRPSIAHVDAEHSESAVLRNLRFVASVLAEDGILVVDDYRNVWFPGVVAGLVAFMQESGFRAFAFSEQKAYLCRESLHEAHLFRAATLLDEAGSIPWYRGFRDLGLDSYDYEEAPDVLGRRCLLVIGDGDVLPPELRRRAMARAALRACIPPGLVKLVRSSQQVVRSAR